jgi:hypothetical protein
LDRHSFAGGTNLRQAQSSLSHKWDQSGFPVLFHSTNSVFNRSISV